MCNFYETVLRLRQFLCIKIQGSGGGLFEPYILKSNRGDFVAYLGHTDRLTDTCLVFVLQLHFRTDLVSCYDC